MLHFGAKNKTCRRETRPPLVVKLNYLVHVKNKERAESHVLQFGAKNKTCRRETRPSLVVELNSLVHVKNKEWAESHVLLFGAKNMTCRRVMSEIRNVRRNIHSTLAPK